MIPAPGQLQNPFRDPAVMPDWAHLSRLAGDRAAILFEDLRRRIARIEGLREDLYYGGPECGWAPRYRMGEVLLFIAHILPGRLEVTVEFERPLRGTFLASPRISKRIKQAIQGVPVGTTPGAPLRIPLPDQASVRSFANLVLMKGKFMESLHDRGQVAGR